MASTRSPAAPNTAPMHLRRASSSAACCARRMHMPVSRIDTSKAEKLPGVKAVITSADLPDLTGDDRGMYDILENCMAREESAL